MDSERCVFRMDAYDSIASTSGEGEPTREDVSLEKSQMSIAEMLAETANDALKASVPEGFEWIEQYGMFYSPSTGFFYDQNTCLFFHSESQTYYYFDDASQQYVFYKSLQKKKWTKKEYKRLAVEMFGSEGYERMDQASVDVCEAVFSLVDRVVKRDTVSWYREKLLEKRNESGVDDLIGIDELKELEQEIEEEEEREKKEEKRRNTITKKRIRYDSETGEAIEELIEVEVLNGETCYEEEDADVEEDEREQMMQEEGFREPPLLRIIDQFGNLHIITIVGGKIGSSEVCDIQDPGVSKIHCEIEYNSTDSEYVLRTLSPKRTVQVDGTVVHAGNEAQLHHGSTITVSELVLIVHVHYGYNMCPGCDPGIMKPVTSANNKEVTKAKVKGVESARRDLLRAMKKSYGISDFDTERAPVSDHYADRARKRRKIVGSDRGDGATQKKVPGSSGDIYANCAARPLPDAIIKKPANMNESISSENKGFRLLKGMGWKEGEGLGKQGEGRVEPVAAKLKTTRSGLGSEAEKATPASKRELLAQKMKERFNKIPEKTDIFEE